MGIGDDQAHTAQATRPQRAQERRPERLVLAVAHGQAQHLPGAIGGHPGGHHDGLGHHPSSFVGLDVGGVEEDVGELDVVQATLAELLHGTVEVGADPTHLALGHPGVDAERPRGGPPPTGTLDAPPEEADHQGREPVERRTEDSRTFVRQDGKFETVFYGAPILYHDANGAWRPIDNTVVPDSCFGDNFGRSSRFVDNPAG